MASFSLKIILEDGAVTRTLKFPNGCTVADAAQMVEEKVLTGAAGKDYGLFLTSADDDLSGCWLEDPHRLDYYLLKDGDSLHYRCRVRNLRIRMLDGSVKTMQVDESKSVQTLMMNVCTKLGITNHEEYGLCREDEPMEEHPSTGTLTLKRKHQHKEKDAALQQLSKKLKTDDNVEWLEQHKTLREMAVAPTETLLLKRRLFYSDRKVDARDPVQLNLLYVQARDAVLEGRQPVTEEQAVTFAGIQCQVQYGDYQEEKHKHGFIENLSEFLPQTYANAWGMEKKVTKEHKKLAGLTQLEAKHLYTKTARDLPTYGVTFFLVKEMQKGKKKLVPRLLGINAVSILRLDETTKEVLQTWPLTQVKTYKAGKGEMFTLNFGDYSEKEYCVKTNDAYRIRDILQGYIDLHRKRMEAAFNTSGDEGGIIHMATVESGKGSTMEVVSHSAHKTVETSFVGPSRIISVEEGSKAQAHGAQIVTAHTVIVTNKQLNEQSAKATGVTMRGEMSIDTGRKLNDFNANAVKIVTLLNDPNEANIKAAKQIVETIVKDMPTVVAGMKHCIDQQTDEAAKKKLTLELNELCDNVNQLNGFLNPQDAQEAAMRIANLTTQMYSALDGPSKRRSQLIRNSRKSFIEDDKTQATLQRASFINCVGAAHHAVDDARDILTTKYEGLALIPEEVKDLERSARDRLARLNAAIARLAAAHADPKNIDYAAAVSAMNTIKELVPKLAKDAQVLSAVKDGKDRSGLIREMQELLDITGMISQNIGCDDLQKIHDEADKFAKKSRKLQFIFGHTVQPDMETEILDLTKDIDDKTRLLVATVSQLAEDVKEPISPKIINAAHKCANAASSLTSCAQLTAPSIQEAHCRSAFVAALEDLASSEKLLDAAYRSLLDHPMGRERSESIRNQSAELKKALDRLRNVCDELDDDSTADGPEATERRRLRFITRMSGAPKTLDSCNKILKDNYKGSVISPAEAEQLERSTRNKLDRLNAAVARLAAAHADPKNIDYAAADNAMITINEIVPELANDTRALSTVKDGKNRASLIREMQELLDATGMIYQTLGSEDLQKMQSATNVYTKKAKRLQFILGNSNNAAEIERKQQHFARSLNGLQETMDTCDKIVASNPNGQLLASERSLWYSLGELNVVIGSLLAATKDKEDPDYEAAETALVNIACHMPDVIKEMRYKSASYPFAERDQVQADIQALNDAVRAIAGHTMNGEDVNQALVDYAKATGKLTYIFDTHASQPKEHELIDLTRKVCATTSELLAHVYGVAAEVGGETGYDLDITGTKVAESAQDLLTAVQLAAPTIHVPPCKTMVLQSTKDLGYALDNVARIWPAACNTKDDVQKLEKLKLQADVDLQRLTEAVQIFAEPSGLWDPTLMPFPDQWMELDSMKGPQESENQVGSNFIRESSLDNKRKDLHVAILRAQDVIKQPLSSKQLSPAEEKTLQQSLANKLADLNAAIADLMNATYGRDPSTVGHSEAESSMGVIERLLPEVVQDVRALNSGKNDAETRALMTELEALCTATMLLAYETGSGIPAVMKSFVDQYARSSGKLAFTCTPPNAAQKNQKQVIHKAQDVFDRSSMMVEAVDKLLKSHPNDFRNKAVDEKAQLVERAACALLSTAQVTASSLNTSQCRSVLHQAARDLSRAISHLDTATHQLVGADLLEQQRKNFDEAVRELMATISGLEEDSKQLNASNKTISAEKEKNRLKFVASRSAAQTALDSAVEELKKTGKVAPLAPPQAALLQARLADKLATLNAAIATLLTATRDPENPDYVLAESATATIQELVPDLIKDAKTLPSGKDQAARPMLLEQLQELCEATRAISSGEKSGKEKELQEAVEKYTKASGKLVYTFNSRANAAKEDQIIDLTKSTCQKTSELLERVYDLEQGVEGQAAVDLDAQGSKLADAAQNLLTTAEITAPSISSPLCQSSLLTSVSALSSSVDHLFSSPVLTLPQHAAKRQHLQEARAKVDQEIERLKAALKDERVLDAAAIEKAKKEKLRFIASMASAEVAIQNAEKEITEPYGKPLPAPVAAALQESLTLRLATLNAAINSLTVATSDHNNPDYLEAESVSKTIRELIPDIVKDSKNLSSTMDQKSRKDLLEQIKAICEATRLLGASATSEQLSPEELNKAATQYSLASGKLNFVFNPHADQKKTHQIIDTCKSASIKTSEMLHKVQDLAKQAGADGAPLETKGAQVSDAARSLLTTAQLTAHSVNSPRCQTVLLDSSDRLSSTIQKLQTAWTPIVKAPKFKAVEEQLAKDKEAVEMEIVRLRRLVNDGAGVLDAAAIEKAKKEKLRFITSMASTEVAIQNAEKEITEPYGKPLPAPVAAALQESLTFRLATLNAAINSLAVATNDHNNPDYLEAESVSKIIRELIPDIVKDSKNLSSTLDQKSRKDLLEQIKALCKATRLLGAHATSEQLSPEELNNAATQYSLASGKLNFVFNPHADQKKTHQIIDTCKSACIKTSEMLHKVQDLAKQTGADGPPLETKGAQVSDAARSLLTTAQLTAHSVNSPRCQTALLDSSDRLCSTIQELQTAWMPIVKAPKFKAVEEQLAKDKEAVEMEIVTLRKLVNDGAGVKGKKPPVPVRTDSEKGTKKGSEARVIGATREFLDRLRSESSIEIEDVGELVKSPTSASQPKTDEEKHAKQQFTKGVQDARKSICSAEEVLQTAFTSDGKARASLDDVQILALNKQMEHKLARANAAAAHLLACRGGDRPDYTLASKCVGAVSDLMPAIAADAITLADLKDPVGRKLFLSDTIGLCTASKNLCETAKTDKKKLKDVAVEFGNQSSKMLYAVSTDIDPSQEKEVLLRVKAAGDVACRVTEGSVEGPAAGRCAGQATTLMYTAKLVAPSIQDLECQDALISASKDLSTQLKTIPSTNPKLTQELMELEKILDALRSDVAGGKLVKRKEEKLVIENTPLRKLTALIIEDSKTNAEDPTNPPAERKAMADFANKLTDALKIMDVANARCKKAPHDLRRREELEDAVLNLQQLVLQCRPRNGAANPAQNNIVNLSDFLKDVSTNAERLQQAAHKAESEAGPHERAAGAVRAQCGDLLHAAAPRTPAHAAPMLDVDHAAKECVSRVQKINTTIECCPEGAGKANLQKEARPLNESCTLLQYASQSALATAQCAAFDEALNDLTDLENRIDKMLQPRQGEKHTAQSIPSASLLASRARLATAAAGVSRDAQQLAPAFTHYVADLRAHVDVADEQKRKRLADHLKKLQDRLKLLTLETGRQVVTWRPANEGEVVAITDEILKELDNAEAVIGAKADKNHIAYEDLKKLLLPVDTYTMEGDKKKLEAKLEPYATKLNSMAETLTLSIGKPGSLARTAHVTAESAVQLTALAKALKCDEDPTKNSRIDETSQELCFVTYNLLKTAESVSNEPNTFESRRRMMDACRSLTDAINKLVRASSSGDKLQRECNELNRSLQLRQSTLQPRPTCALPYAECISALQTELDAIKNLKSEEPVSREEFSTSLDYLASAVNNNVDYAEHCAYLLSVSEQHPELSKDGMVDTERIQKLIGTAQDSCFRTTRPGIVHQAKEESSLLSKQLADLKQAIQDCSPKVKDEEVKKRLVDASSKVDAAGTKLNGELNSTNVSVETLTPSAFATIEALSSLRSVTEHPSLAPIAAPSPAAQKRADDVIQQSKELLTRASGLMRAIKTSENQQAMTWVMFNTYTKGVIEISEKLVICIRENGQQACLIEGAIEEDEGDMTAVSYVQTQVLIANKWLQKPSFKAQIKADGEQAAKNVIDVGKKMMTHLKEGDREEMKHLVEECEQLLQQCSAKYTLETGSVLMDRLKDLAKAVDRSIVTMVVEDLLEDEEPLADLEIMVDAERDEAKRKFVLERKIADLLAHLGRVTKTARVVADGQGGGDGAELRKCSSQAELLAPMLVKAAEKRVIHHSDTAVAEEYRTQLAQYSQSLSKVRDLCDRAVDPMQFVQTAEETMQRMKEESTAHQTDLQKCSNTSTAIRKLAHRVINVSMSSQNAQRDPELMRALTAAQQKLKEAEPARTLRASKLPDWRNNIQEILRATGEVESVLGGEMIFQKQRESDQPIFNAALNLHAAVREWSARDNEIVAVAKRMAVLMAKLSDHMHADKKREVISSSKAIVAASHEVAQLARKLAHECTDMRIRTNLLQVCDQIPTISGQLKMLTTVKGSFLGRQGSEEDMEAMNMLIGNAQNLMMSIQDVVKAAASASVKIRSQRGGPKMRWVRKNYH